MESRTFRKDFQGHKAMGRPVVGNGEPRPKYTFNYPDNLTDGVRGRNNFSSGEWVGMQGKPFDVTIEMSGEKYSSLTLSACIAKGDYVFNPLSITVSVSKNDMDFQTVAHVEYPIEGKNDPDVFKEYAVTFPETYSKYLHVTARTLEALPQWHGAKGRKGYLFVDEVIVK